MNSLVSVDILVNNRPIKQYIHDGKIFVEARKGNKYSIKIHNNTLGRVLAVVSVDDINVVDGENAVNEGTGYIINGFSSYEIKGFRTSNDKVNAFEFADKEQSYAAKNEETGKTTQNCGVIGIKIFYEKILFNAEKLMEFTKSVKRKPIKKTIMPSIYGDQVWGYGDMCSNGDVVEPTITCSCQSLGDEKLKAQSLLRDASPFDTGTKFSNEEIKDSVYESEFERSELHVFTEIFYASRQGLEKLGVKLDKVAEVAFPQSFSKSKFCTPPKS